MEEGTMGSMLTVENTGMGMNQGQNQGHEKMVVAWFWSDDAKWSLNC